MKQYTPTALLVGAVPGALPPLMGWTAVTNGLEAPGLVLFSILFLWQVPHFIAISIFRQEEYERAGLKVLPSVKGLRTSKLQALLWTLVLFVTSLLLVPLRVAGVGYAVTALVMGAMFLGVALMGLRESAGVKWAKQLFITSLIYLTVLFTALMIDAA
jgi:protoheme IX farnesyltransferase